MTERWTCGDCHHATEARVGSIPGNTEAVTVGSGDREVDVEQSVCPDCGSPDWHSRSTRQAFSSLR